LSDAQLPPIDQITPVGTQIVAEVFFGAVAFLAIASAIIVWRRSRNPTYLLLLIGAAITTFNEPVLDILGLVWYPIHGQHVAFEAFGREIPVWVVFAYVAYYGVLSCIGLLVLERASDVRTFVTIEVAVFVVDALLEPLFLRTGLYDYYGHQVAILGLPIVWPFINTLAVFLIAVPVYLGRSWLAGRRIWLLLALPPFAQFLAGAAGLPAFSALFADHPGAAAGLLSALTIALCLLAAVLLTNLTAMRRSGLSGPVWPRRWRAASPHPG
jgi:hypothetical protein